MQFVYEIRPFNAVEAHTIAHWAQTQEDLWSLTGQPETPLTADLVAAWPMEANFAFTLRYYGDLVAYGEIVEDEVEGDAEIQHLIVAPDMRRLGHGKAMLERLCQFLSEARPWPHVWVRVPRQHSASELCARSAGFEEQLHVSGPRFLWLKKQLRRASP